MIYYSLLVLLGGLWFASYAHTEEVILSAAIIVSGLSAIVLSFAVTRKRSSVLLLLISCTVGILSLMYDQVAHVIMTESSIHEAIALAAFAFVAYWGYAQLSHQEHA